MNANADETMNATASEPATHINFLPQNIPPVWVRSATLSGILLLMVLYTMYLAASLLIPMALALFLSLILTPVIRGLVRMRIPQTLSALIVMLSVAGIMTAGIYVLAAPAQDWMKRAPDELRSIEHKLARVKEPIDKALAAKEQINKLISVKQKPGAEADGESRDDATEIVSSSLVDSVLSRTPTFLYGTAVMLILLFFILASHGSFLNKVVHVTSDFGDKRRVVETARELQQQIARYLGVVTIINIGVGVVVASAMYVLDLPNPLLWGVMTGVLNFIPYVGVLISMVVVTFVSILTFHTPFEMLLPAMAIFVVNVVEGQFLTPIIAGNRLSLSPVAVFVSIAVLGWIWGLIGVLLAVPMLASVKLVCEHIEPLQDVAVFLGT